MMKQICSCLVAFFVLACTLPALAQSVVEYDYEVKFKGMGKDAVPEKRQIWYGHYIDYSEAEAVFQDLKRKKMTAGLLMSDDYNEHSIRLALEGKFNVMGLNGMGIVIVTEEEEILLVKNDDGKYINKTVNMPGGENYKLSCSKVSDTHYRYEVLIETRVLDEVKKFGKSGPRGNGSVTVDPEDGYQYFNLHLELPARQRESSSRIALFPYIVDCQTEDTIDYLIPAVYEGADYHALQDKRKGFNYRDNDPLGGLKTYKVYDYREEIIKRPVIRDTFYVRDDYGRLIPDGEDEFGNERYRFEVREISNDSVYRIDSVRTVSAYSYMKPIEQLEHDTVFNIIHIDTVIRYRKPEKSRIYRCYVRYAMEDYHHVYEYKDHYGTCLAILPFRFLQMSNMAEEMALDPKFYEPPDERPDEGGREDLGMQFIYNTATLIEDSVYRTVVREIQEDMEAILRENGKLIDPVIEAYASPDGSEAVNLRLAAQRAETARRVITVPSGSRIATKPLIDTWEHTAELLEQSGHQTLAQVVREAMSKSKDNRVVTGLVKSGCGDVAYRDVVKPVLQSQCRISFRYKFYMNVRMDAKQAKLAYYRNKHGYYSSGDYYNMFAEIKDSAEIDTLTEIAYDRVIRKNQQYDRALAPYLVNQMAVLKIKRMQPDKEILRRMIYHQSGHLTLRLPVREGMATIVKNRPEIVLNQAIMHYLSQEPDSARWYIDELVRNGYSSPSLKRMIAHVNFKRLYMKPADKRTKEEQHAFDEALSFIEQSGQDNRAVLYTEFAELNKRNLAWPEVHKMSDESPLKWYLMGLLWVTRDGQESNYPLGLALPSQTSEDFRLLGADEKLDLSADDPERYKEYMLWEQDFLKEHPDAKPVPKPVEAAESADDLDIRIDGIPYYMAYFQKSFDLNKEFMKFYFSDGKISEQMRQKKLHAYKEDRIPAYRKLFSLRKVQDDAERARILNREAREKRDREKLAESPQPSSADAHSKATTEQNADEGGKVE